MGLQAQLEALSLPVDTEFPGTPQGLLDLIAQYMAITGLESFNGINYGSTSPSEDNRDKPWFKIDGSGNPIGWFSWNGSEWAPIPVVIPSGTTAQRPTSPQEGQTFLDTDINVVLISNGTSGWHTLSGSPGDLKHVVAATIEDALAKNPGWSQYAPALNRVLAGAGGGHDYGDTGGSDSLNISVAQLPSHTHTLATSSGLAGLRSNIDLNLGGSDYGSQVPTSEVTTGSAGSGDAVDMRQPTLYVWILVKD